ncbi:ROK family protein [Paramixta manurensis]|uniref:ROK family protein n=1 Tax=Paramixta manurensis TaxID=2740817 RepID=A0A6M8UBI1_9GAMM|nr:ROK family protein [Erwiniaceae bacterium PD-1]
MSLQGMNNQRVRHYNKQVLCALLYREKVASKSTLARLSQLSIPAVGKILDELLAEHAVQHDAENLHRRGLGGGSYRIAPASHLILCINVSPSLIESVVVNNLIVPQGELVSRAITLPTPETLLQEIVQTWRQHRQQHATPLKIALSVHGQVNPQTGVSQNMPQTPWKQPIEIKYLLEEQLGTEILLDNDCVMLALAEKWQNAANQQDFCVINVDYGIGSSFVIQQQIYRGSLFGSGQIGHTIVDIDGSACSCGRYGCLETLASLSALKRRARIQLKATQPLSDAQEEIRTPRTAELIALYHQGDSTLTALVTRAAQAIGLSLYNFLNILNINRIYLYGRSCGFGEQWLNTIIEQTKFNPFDHQDQTRAQATHIGFGHLTRQQQVMGIGYLYVEQTLAQMK